MSVSPPRSSSQNEKPPVVPLTILSGFLGSGKTSLLNHLLHHPEGRKITALINDFGSLNIDAEIIARQHGAQIELANGCVCCSLGDDLAQGLADILNQPQLPDCLIIEASGIADPKRIAAFASVDRQLRLDAIICCIDSSLFNQQSQDPRLRDTLDRQIDSAHLFALTKRDCMTDPQDYDRMSHHLRARRPNIPQIDVAYGQVRPELILSDPSHISPPQTSTPQISPEHETQPAPPSDTSSPSQAFEHPFVQWSGHLPPHTPEDLEAVLRDLGPALLRAKGFCHDHLGAYIFNYVYGRWHIDRLLAEETQAGPHRHTSSPHGSHDHFVIIGFPELSLSHSALKNYL